MSKTTTADLKLGDERFILACRKSWRRPTKRMLRRVLERRGNR